MIFEKICIHAHRPFPSYLLVQNFLMKISLVCIKSEQYKYFTFGGLLCKFLGSWGVFVFRTPQVRSAMMICFQISLRSQDMLHNPANVKEEQVQTWAKNRRLPSVILMHVHI